MLKTASDRALLSRKRYVHLATHGLVDQQTPGRSTLLLARDRLPQPEPGQKARTGELTVAAIRRTWKLDADLVVLSACRTALGKEVHGEGLIGLTRGFMYAGASRVVSSVWNVDDRASARLMSWTERFCFRRATT